MAVIVPVMMMGVGVWFFSLYHAALGYRAALAFELDGGVVDAEAGSQRSVDLF